MNILPLFVNIGCFYNQTDGLVQKIQSGVLCSAKGLNEIDSGDECKRAAKQLGLEWDHAVKYWNFPACFHVEYGRARYLPRHKVYFNENPNPIRTNLSSQYAAICQGNQKLHNGKS